MRLNNLSESSWEDANIQDPNEKPIVTNSGYLLQSMISNLNKDAWSVHDVHYIVDGIVAQIMDKKTGIFYDIMIVPRT